MLSISTPVKIHRPRIHGLAASCRACATAGKTLSETVVQLIEDAEHKEKYANQMSTLKNDLQALLGKNNL